MGDPASTTRAPGIDEVLQDPAASVALKVVLRAWRSRDVVDAAGDARLLCRVFEAQADFVLGRPS